MLVDLVQTTTADGVRLDGAFQTPTVGKAALGLDALCFVHGTGGNFYSSTLFDGLAERLLQLGCGVLRVNTRGHDLVSTAATARGGRRLGAAYEVGDDCRHDIRAWLDWLRRRAGPRVGLVGHSFGAVKCLYALAREPGLEAACVVALSPPRLSHAVFAASPQGREFLDTYALAERDVASGRGQALLDVRLPLPYVITAEGYVEKYGPEERYDFVKFVAAVPCPTLITWGGIEVENNMAFRGAPEAVAEVVGKGGRVRCEVIPGADHFYSGVREQVIARAESWLRSL
jgi:pimeloyl-ACP methyl ester carboxylesterase